MRARKNSYEKNVFCKNMRSIIRILSFRGKGIEILYIEGECSLGLLEKNGDKILAKLQLTLNLFSAGKFKLSNKNAHKTEICFKY